MERAPNEHNEAELQPWTSDKQRSDRCGQRCAERHNDSVEAAPRCENNCSFNSNMKRIH
ncbi:hypothetical protein NQZ68_037945 [Dissostichus eleginoides]|nr:hypothetical protein NQZ68_037945 [Dissostichus eleginoides]